MTLLSPNLKMGSREENPSLACAASHSSQLETQPRSLSKRGTGSRKPTGLGPTKRIKGITRLLLEPTLEHPASTFPIPPIEIGKLLPLAVFKS